MNKNNRILKWLVIVLVIINIASIGTMIYTRQAQRAAVDESIMIDSGTGVNVLNGQFFRQQLAFSEEQMAEFRKANQAFRPVARDISVAIDSLKSGMFTELNKQHPDTALLNRITVQVGGLHAQLKYQTYRFYLGVKTICDSSQAIMLQEAFAPLFKTEGLGFPGRRQHRGGYNSK